MPRTLSGPLLASSSPPDESVHLADKRLLDPPLAKMEAGPDDDRAVFRKRLSLECGARILLVRSRDAGVAELADALDSKSSDRKIVWVRAPPPAFSDWMLLEVYVPAVNPLLKPIGSWP